MSSEFVMSKTELSQSNTDPVATDHTQTDGPADGSMDGRVDGSMDGRVDAKAAGPVDAKAVKKTPMQIQYDKIKAAHMDCILFFRLGDFYEMFNKDAEIAAEVLGIVLTSRKNKSGSQKMCGIPFHSSENYINKLVESGYKVAIAEQVSDPSSKGIVEREVTSIVTPATNLSHKQTEKRASLMALEQMPSGWGFLVADLNSLELNCGQVINLEQIREVILHFGVSEVVFQKSIAPGLQQILVEMGIHTKLIDKSKLERVSESELESLNLEKTQALMFASIRFYVQEHLGHFVRSFGSCKNFKSEKSFRLSYKTAVNLEIFSNFDGSNKNSVFNHINFCRTSMGSRKLMTDILAPLMVEDLINKRLSQVEQFCLYNLSSELGELLKSIKNIPRIVARIETRKATPADMVSLLLSLEAAVEVSKNKMVCETLGKQTFETDLNPMLLRLRTLILQEPKVILTKGYIFEKNTSQQLYELRDILENSHGKISQMLEEQKQATGIANMKIKYNKVFGYFIEVSKGKTEMVPEHYIRRQTLTSAERYTTPVLQEFEQKVMNAESNLVDLEIQMFNELLEFCDAFLLKTLELSDLIGRVDVLCSHAECVNRYEFCKPEICLESAIEIEGGFHPVVKNIIPYGEFIENDLSLLDQKFMVLTGPNMGGKSTFLRQNAIIVLLASIGAFVPARKAKIGLCDGIFTRVGASDNLSKGQSTFMVEMEETSEILRIATDRSFVIIDELGRGTSSLDGIAISSSVVKFMNKEIGCRTLFATHFFEIASLVDGLTGTGNLCVKVTHDSQGKPVFSRKIVSGSIDKSYGVEVAEMAGMPAEVVEASKHYLNEIEAASAQVVKGSYGGENLGITTVGQEANLDSVTTASFGVNLDKGDASEVKHEEQVDASDLSRVDLPCVDLPGVDFPGADAGVADLSGADVGEKLSEDNTACNSFHQSVKNKDVLESVTAENNRFLEAENLDMKEGLNVVVKADNDRPQRSLFAGSPEEKTEVAKRELQKAKNMMHLEKHGLKIIETIKAININSLTPIQAMLKLNELIDFAHKKVRTKD